jgi:biotin transport system permease protein
MLTLTSAHKTWVHSLPAGGKLAVLCAVTVVLFAILSVPALLIAALLIAALPLSCGAEFARQSLRGLRPLWPFILIVALWHDPNWQSIILRMICAVALANFVTMTTRLSDMITILETLARPLSPILPPQRLALAIALMIRFLPVLMHEADQIALAWRARSPRRPRWHMFVPLTLAALDDADRVAEAIRARGGIL